MIQFDQSQERVLGLDPARHARVLGAPGSGKSRLLVESYARVTARPGWSAADAIVIAPDRTVASRLRQEIETRLQSPLGGTPARTATSFAFAALKHLAAIDGRPPARLLTGTVHDEVVAEVITEWLESGKAAELQFAPEVLTSAQFRAELREFSGVLDDFAISAVELLEWFRVTESERPSGPFTRLPSNELAQQWVTAIQLIIDVDARIASERPGEISSRALLRAAAAAIRADDSVPVPRLIFIDDAQELGEGQVGLLEALAARGARIWAFGDPDIATGAFRGERSRMLAGIDAELGRRRPSATLGAASVVSAASTVASQGSEQFVVLERVHRHGSELRGFVGELTERIGASGVGQQRSATSVNLPGVAQTEPVQFATAPSFAEQLGAVGHRLRRRHLGVGGGEPVAWSDMAVICRSRGEAHRAARVLAEHQVPTSVSAGGVVLREHQLIRELVRLIQHTLGISKLVPSEIGALLGGTIGGLDPVALRRFRGALRLQDDRAAKIEEREPVSTESLISEGFSMPGGPPLIDSRGGRRLRRLGALAQSAETVHANGGTPREVLWAVWSGARLAEKLQDEALAGRGPRSAEAHRLLDAVMGLFFALQRHEEQASPQPIDELLDELITSTVPEDSLASRSELDVVTVTTPQATIGKEFSVVCILGMQDGTWPNLRSRGLMLGVTALERWLRGEEPSASSRRDTLHDELRLFAQSASRARDELLVVAVADEDNHPSSFFGMGRAHLQGVPLPSSRLTLRGSVAEMRRRLTDDPEDAEALRSLVGLTRSGAPGAHPDEWYGMLTPSTAEPVVDLSDPGTTVRVSPSNIETAETCPLNWAISKLSGGEAQLSQNIGTLLHRAFEIVTGSVGETVPQTVDEIMRVVDANWSALIFDAKWQEDQQRAVVRSMAESLIDYLGAFDASERELIGTEVSFSLRLGQAEVSGVADRLEARHDESGQQFVSVVDLKTGKKAPSKAERETHAQLQAYQLGVLEGAFDGVEPQGPHESDGARLLYVHPKSLNKTSLFVEAEQPPLQPATAEEFKQRVQEVAEIMAAGEFVANVEHHCTDPFALGNSCRIHIVPPVSHA